MNYQVVRAKRLASAWELKMSGSFCRELEQYSCNDWAASFSLVAFGEISISACNDRIPRKQLSTLGNTPNLNIGSQTKETLHWFIRPGLLHWFPDQNSRLHHPTGTSALVLTGKATLLPTLFFALHKQDSASGSFKQQFALNLHPVSVVHFALIDANWRISSISCGFGLLGFCLPRIWIHVLRWSLELSGSIAPFLQVSTFADGATAMFDCSPRTK